MRFLRKIFITAVLLVIFCSEGLRAQSKSNYNQLSKVFAKNRYYVPSVKYKTACKSLSKGKTRSTPELSAKKIRLVKSKKKRIRKKPEQDKILIY